MTTEFHLPELGENVEGGDLVHILVAPGDSVAEDQSVLELETEKASMEVPSTVSGRVKEIHVKEGDKVKVGQLIFTVEDGAGTKQASKEPQPSEDVRKAQGDKQEEEGKPARAAKEREEAKDKEPPEPEQPKSAEEEAEEGEEPAPAAKRAAEPAKPEPATASAPAGVQEFRLPELGENVESGDLVNILVAVGDTIAKDQPVIELETEKATMEVPSSVAGRVKEIRVQVGEKVRVGQVILTVEGSAGGAPERQPRRYEEQAAPSETPPPEKRAESAKPAQTAPAAPSEIAAPAEAAESAPQRRVVPAAPSARRVARELGMEIHRVPGSGPGGRISVRDVKAYVRSVMKGAIAGTGARPLTDFSRWGAIERKPMQSVRRATAHHLSVAWNTIPHVTQHDKADITRLEDLRAEFGPKAESQGGKLTVTAVLLRVVASALRMFPQFAASVDLAREEIIYKTYCHIGVAVDTDRGLLVPVIRDVDQKNILTLGAELTRMAEKAKEHKLRPEEMEGGVFTITNLGGIGGTSFTPIVNYPEVAILGVSRAHREPVFTDGTFVPRLMLPLSLSYDHRLIDGADAARFLRWVAQALEQPFLLPLEG